MFQMESRHATCISGVIAFSKYGSLHGCRSISIIDDLLSMNPDESRPTGACISGAIGSLGEDATNGETPDESGQAGLSGTSRESGKRATTGGCISGYCDSEKPRICSPVPRMPMNRQKNSVSLHDQVRQRVPTRGSLQKRQQQKFLEDTMKLYSWFSKLMILVMLFIPISLTHAITMALELHELVDESDIVVKGTVKSSQLVSDNVGTKDILNRRLGTLYSIKVERVLYGKGDISHDIFYDSDLEEVNWVLGNLCKRKPIHIFAFQKRPLKFPDGATYYKDRSQLFFLKISDFRTPLPETVTIINRIRSEDGIRLQQLTKSELLEKYYFEASFGVRQSTWDLAETERQAALPSV